MARNSQLTAVRRSGPAAPPRLLRPIFRTFHVEAVMNEDIVQGKWKELRGKVRQRWGKVTGDDVDQLQGTHEELVGLLQKRYGYERKQAAKEVKEWVNRY
jgi:uncharacterized protein YjbJ (UPF0337 family)